MKKLIFDIFRIIIWSGVISLLTILIVWLLFHNKKDLETIATYIFYISFIYLFIGFGNTIGNYTARGDINYQLARTTMKQNAFERAKEDVFSISKSFYLTLVMFFVGLILILLSYYVLSNFEFIQN